MEVIHYFRLSKLANRLEKVGRKSPKKFDITDWIQKSDSGCGTVACVAGHAGLMPEFRKLGLEFNLVPNEYRLEEDEPLFKSQCLLNGDQVSPEYAFATFFGDEAAHAKLCYPDSRYYPRGNHTTALQAARGIRKFLKDQSEDKPATACATR